jgi:outer membrane protein OmpA-like peptidoglycan-associated protein
MNNSYSFAVVALISLSTLVCAQSKNEFLVLNAESSTEYAPVVAADGRYMVFQSNRTKGFKLYESRQVDGVWSVPQSIEAINSYRAQDLSIIGSPYLSADGKTLFFSAWYSDTYGELDIYYAVRKEGEWSKPEHLSEVINSKQAETAPSLSEAGDTLFFVRNMQVDRLSPACSKVFYSVKSSEGKWSSAVEWPANNSCVNRLQQTYAQGHFWKDANNNMQLMATAPSQNDEAMSKHLASLTNAKTPWITPKEDMVIYASNGDLQTSPLAFDAHIRGTSFTGKVKDAEKGTVVNEVMMLVQDTLDNSSFTVTNDEQGDYVFYVPASYTYKVRVTAHKYDTLYMFYTVPQGKAFSILSEDILIQHRKVKKIFNVSDKDNGKNLKVKVKLTNKNTGEELVLDENMQQDGKYTVHLREGDEYTVEINNIEGYAFSKSTMNSKDEDISIPVERIKEGAFLEVEDIFFDFNSYQLTGNSYKALDKLVQWMKTNKKVMVRIEAHTDDVGSEEFNLSLSDKRAKEIVKYLTRKGVSAARMQALGLGKSKPRVESDTEEARAQNRRVELNILTIQK